MTLDTQLHLYSGTFIEAVRPVENDKSIVCIKKPKPGTGLWTSTWNTDTRSSAWTDWCIDVDFGAPYEQSWVLLTPKQDARIFVVDSVENLHTLLRRYRRAIPQAQYDDIYVSIDFPRLATEYDALHLTEEGQWATRLSMPFNLYGWDCESTVWFRWCFERIEHMAVPPLRLPHVVE